MIQNAEYIRRIAEGSQRHSSLVFVRGGIDTSLARALANPDRHYDLMLSLYQPAPEIPKLIDAGIGVYAGGWSKFHAALRIQQRFKSLDRYEQVLFLDADIGIDVDSVNRLFNAAKRAELALCQPSLSVESSTAWPFLRHDPRARGLRPTNFVEVMAPCFSRAALTRCLASFDRSISTWGLDFLWPMMLRYRSIAVIDAVQMRHLQPTDESNGAFYRYLNSIGIDQRAELAQLRASCPRWFRPGPMDPLLGWRGPFLLRKLSRFLARLRRA